MKVTTVEPGSIAEEVGILPGDELLEVNGKRVIDAIDYRFHETDEQVELKIARDGEIILFDIEKDSSDTVGIDFEEMKILQCGNDCIFCFVDQNPKNLRSQLYFRDGDYRLSFMYGNYTTMTNAGPAIIQRIIDQRLSPQYVSVHVTDYEVRKKLMGLKKDDHILDKLTTLHDNGIDLHTQIVLCPGINDGQFLKKTVFDLYKLHKRVVSLAVVPVGLTDHRWGLNDLKRVDHDYANMLLDTITTWQEKFRREIGRGFVYPSDEFFIVAGREVPPAKYYDGFPQIENGVGLVRSFLTDCAKQSKTFPAKIPARRHLTLVTGTLASGFVRGKVMNCLKKIGNLSVTCEVAENTLFGSSVTVSGLLSGKCIYSALKGKECGDMVLLPPDILNADGLFLDDMTLPDLEKSLKVPVMVNDGSWSDVLRALKKTTRKEKRTSTLLPGDTPSTVSLS